MNHTYRVGDKIRFIDDGDLLEWLVGKVGTVIEVLGPGDEDYPRCPVRASVVDDDDGMEHSIYILREHCEPLEEDYNL